MNRGGLDKSRTLPRVWRGRKPGAELLFKSQVWSFHHFSVFSSLKRRAGSVRLLPSWFSGACFFSLPEQLPPSKPWIALHADFLREPAQNFSILPAIPGHTAVPLPCAAALPPFFPSWQIIFRDSLVRLLNYHCLFNLLFMILLKWLAWGPRYLLCALTTGVCNFYLTRPLCGIWCYWPLLPWNASPFAFMTPSLLVSPCGTLESPLTLLPRPKNDLKLCTQCWVAFFSWKCLWFLLESHMCLWLHKV